MMPQSQPFSVSQALALAKNSLEQISATIVGEVSEFSDKPGYKAVYFTIRDASASLSCLIWRNAFVRAGVEIRQGALVEVSGVFSVYAAKGRMNFEVRTLRLAGEGELRLKVAQLAAKLQAEGLMALERKRPLPGLPTKIAVVTSPRGKAIHDVLRTLRRRFPLAEVLVAGVPVEGATAAQSICTGLLAAEASGAEVILLVRGGGSYEDLMPFNDESLARTIACSTVAVVTGIGHEPDNTIADMVADHRASTPTAAAEFVAPDLQELKGRLKILAGLLAQALSRRLEREQIHFSHIRDKALFRDPSQLIAPFALVVEGAALRLQRQLPDKLEKDRVFIEEMRTRLKLLAGNLLRLSETTKELNAMRLHALSPLAVLGRGYSIAYDRNDHVIDTIDKIDLNQQLFVVLADGRIECSVMGKQAKSLADQATKEKKEDHV